VTEMVTGIDIVREQIKIAAGEPLRITQDDVTLTGHAIECRINAENAAKNFAPAPGLITNYREPTGPGVRVDSGIGPNSEISPTYDPMVSKLIVWDEDRETATKRMIRALGEYEIGNLTTLIPFHTAILATEQWANGETCRELVEDKAWLKATDPEVPAPADDPEDEAPKVQHDYLVEVSGRRFDVKVTGPAFGGGGGGAAAAPAAKKPARSQRAAGGGGGGGGDTLDSPLQGTIFKVLVEAGQQVAEGDLICIIEAMKMENEITAHKDGVIKELAVEVGASIGSGDKIAVIVAESE